MEYTNIKYYKNYKKIALYEKPKSPYQILFTTNDPEGWFIEVIHYKKKSGEISDISHIIEKDLSKWMEWKETNGWIKT